MIRLSVLAHRPRLLHVLPGHLNQLLKVRVKRGDFPFGEIFDTDQMHADGSSRPGRSDDDLNGETD